MNRTNNRSLHVAREAMKASGTIDAPLSDDVMNETATMTLDSIQTWILANEYPNIDKLPLSIDIDETVEIYLKGIEGKNGGIVNLYTVYKQFSINICFYHQ